LRSFLFQKIARRHKFVSPHHTTPRLAKAPTPVDSPEEVAGAAVFLASSDASFIAGTELFVAGGQAQI
jgi:NAD(P)-dependent dehydrogenase (short-subunit alcohol dehydrogenase family)